MSSQPPSTDTFAVRVVDLFHYVEPDSERLVTGFPSFEAAREYARRRTRDSLEEHRSAGTDAAGFRQRWSIYGGECFVPDAGWNVRDEIDLFLLVPATDRERDWKSLHPAPRQE